MIEMTASQKPVRHQRYVCIEFSPTAGCLGSIVSVVTDFCRNVVDDSSIKFAFQLAAYELTENLVKYATGDKTSIRIAVESTAQGPELVLTTENAASPERLLDVAARLTAAETAENPLNHFDQLVQESIQTPGESRLGLGRLRAEGDLLVSHSVVDQCIRIEVRRSIRQFEEGKNQ
jgi:hypothetical protein